MSSEPLSSALLSSWESSGAVVQVWPSAPLVGGAILVWAWLTGTTSAWIVFAIAALVLILGIVLKYVIPARGMNKAGIPQSTLVWGALGGVVGWFHRPAPSASSSV